MDWNGGTGMEGLGGVEQYWGTSMSRTGLWRPTWWERNKGTEKDVR